MGKDSNIVHQYFKKQTGDVTMLVKVNPLQLKAMEITLQKGQDPELREFEAGADMIDELRKDGFSEASAIEFNLYLSGLVK
jgi:hypothetical protein